MISNRMRFVRLLCVVKQSSQGISDATITRELFVLRAALSRVHKRGVMKSFPHIPDPRQYGPQQRWLTQDEVRLLLSCCHMYRLKLYVILAQHTAARLSALYELQWLQVNFGQRIIHLNPVGRRQSTKRRPSIGLGETLAQILQEAFKTFKTARCYALHPSSYCGSLDGTAWSSDVGDCRADGTYINTNGRAGLCKAQLHT